MSGVEYRNRPHETPYTLFLFLFLCLLAVVTCGCSTLHDFAIINSTSAPLQVSITYLDKQESNFRTTTAELFQHSDKKWTDLEASKIKVDKEPGTFILEIAPGKALLVEEAINYLGHDEEIFQIKKLTFVQGEEFTTLEGKEAQTAFRKQEGLDYALIFKGF